MYTPPTPWHKKEVYFLGFKMELIYLILIFLVWNFLLCFVVPLFVGSYFFILSMLSMITVVLIGVAFKVTTLLMILLHFIHKKIINVIYYILLYGISFAVALVYSLIMKISWLMFLNIYGINLFSAYLLCRIIIDVNGSSGDKVNWDEL